MKIKKERKETIARGRWASVYQQIEALKPDEQLVISDLGHADVRRLRMAIYVRKNSGNATFDVSMSVDERDPDNPRLIIRKV